MQGSKNAEEPNFRPALWLDLESAWQLSRDLLENLWSQEMRQRHLYARPAEPPEAYSMRLKTAAFQNRYEPAIRAMSARIADFALVDPAGVIEPYKSDVDLCGNSLEAFTTKVLYDALALESVAIICDFNTELKRPYLTAIAVDQCFCPLKVEEYGVEYIKQLGTGFCMEKPKEDFGSEIVEGIRVYRHRPARAQRYLYIDKEWQKDGSEFKFVGANGQALNELPITWLSLQGFRVLESGAAWSLPLAMTNLIHYNRESELDTAVSVTNLPTLFHKKRQDPTAPAEDKQLGVNHCMVIGLEETVGFLEPSGSGLQIATQRQIHREAIMDYLGQNFIVDNGVAKTATESLINADQREDSIRGIQGIVASAFQEAFKWWYKFSVPSYSPDSKEHPEYQIRDSYAMNANPADVAATLESFTLGLVSREAALAKLIRGGFFDPDDFGGEEEMRKAIATPPPMPEPETSQP